MPKDSPPRVKRDRHGRGMRGPMLPHRVPAYENRSKKFTRLVDEAVTEIEGRFPASMTSVAISTEEVPSKRDLVMNDGSVALGRAERANPSRVVLYRHPIELRSEDDEQLNRIIRDVLALYVGMILDMRPDQIDPNYHGPE